MTCQSNPDGEQALVDLVAELTGMARTPAHTDPGLLRRVNSAFGRVRDTAPDAYRSNRSLIGFHNETEYFAADGDLSDQLPMFAIEPEGGE